VAENVSKRNPFFAWDPLPPRKFNAGLGGRDEKSRPRTSASRTTEPRLIRNTSERQRERTTFVDANEFPFTHTTLFDDAGHEIIFLNEYHTSFGNDAIYPFGLLGAYFERCQFGRWMTLDRFRSIGLGLLATTVCYASARVSRHSITTISRKEAGCNPHGLSRGTISTL